MRTNSFSKKGFCIPGFIKRLSLCVVLTTGCYATSFAQAGIHDPSTTIQNTDGRYWHFATGQGIYAISSSVNTFTNWQAETTPFGSGYPSWVKNYVTGFTGFFWAPDIIKVGSSYWLYYSCAGTGAPAAIGLTKATNLKGPWTDQGMVVAANNAIDPSIMVDGSSIWMAWGNWQTGIDACRLNTTTGKKLNSSTYHLLSGQVEGPCIMKRGSYYYLFFQRGLCCNGVNSTYYVCVMRSTTMTGGFTGERVFMVNKYGRIIGPGHIGYGAGILSYHFYDANDNGAPKLGSTSLNWTSDGWPYAGIFNDAETQIMDDANTNGDVTVFPNPSKGGNFKVSGLKVESTIKVLDLEGRVVFTTQSNGTNDVTLNTYLKPNTYVVRIENNKAATVKKIVVE